MIELAEQNPEYKGYPGIDMFISLTGQTKLSKKFPSEWV